MTHTSPLDSFTSWLRGLGVWRSPTGSWFGGVCAGLATRFGVDPMLIRAAAIILAFAGGFGVAAYLVLWLLLPDSSGQILLQRAVREGHGAGIALAVLTVVVLFGGFGIFASGDSSGWILIPFAVVGYLVYRSRQPGTEGSTAVPPAPLSTPLAGAPSAYPSGAEPMSTDAHSATITQRPTPPTPPTPPVAPGPPWPPPTPRPRRRRPSGFIGLMSLGAAVIAFGLGVLIAQATDTVMAPGLVGAVAALVVTSLIALVLGFRGLAAGFTGFLVAALLVITPIAAVGISATEARGGAGSRDWVPTTTGDLSYSLGVGEATLDLTALPRTPRATNPPQRIKVRAGAASVRIIIPDGLDVRVDSETDLGQIVMPNGSTVENGSSSTTVGDSPDVIVDVVVRLGEIIIEQSGTSS